MIADVAAGMEAEAEYGAAVLYAGSAALATVLVIITGYLLIEDLAVDDWLFAKSSKSSKGDRSTDTPSWSKGEKPGPNESGKDFAERMMKDKYSDDWNGDRGPGSEFSKLRKYGDRYDK